MSKRILRHRKPVSGGRKIIRTLIRVHSEGFELGDEGALHEALIDIISGQRVARHAAGVLLRMFTVRVTS